MAQQVEPVPFDEFLSNAAPIFAQIEQEGKGVLVEHDGALFSVKMKRPKTKKGGRAITSQDSILHITAYETAFCRYFSLLRARR